MLKSGDSDGGEKNKEVKNDWSIKSVQNGLEWFEEKQGENEGDEFVGEIDLSGVNEKDRDLVKELLNDKKKQWDLNVLEEGRHWRSKNSYNDVCRRLSELGVKWLKGNSPSNFVE